MNPTDKLWKALLEDNASSAKEAIEKGANIHSKRRGWSFLRWAVQEGQLEIIKLLVDAGADLSEKDKEEFTLLDQAVGEGHLEVVIYLLSKGTNVNHPTANCTALHTAAAWGRMEIAQVLLDNGADKRIKDKKGRNARYWASYYGHSQLAEMLKVRKRKNAT